MVVASAKKVDERAEFQCLVLLSSAHIASIIIGVKQAFNAQTYVVAVLGGIGRMPNSYRNPTNHVER